MVLDRHGWERGARHEVIAVTRVANTSSRRLLAAVGLREVERFEEWGAERPPQQPQRRDGQASHPGRGRKKGWTCSGRASGVGP